MPKVSLSLEVVDRPKYGIQLSNIPRELADLLEQIIPDILKDPENKELTLTASTQEEVLMYCRYAREWGNQYEPKLNIRKCPNRREMNSNQARLTVQLQSESKPLGRKPKGNVNG